MSPKSSALGKKSAGGSTRSSRVSKSNLSNASSTAVSTNRGASKALTNAELQNIVRNPGELGSEDHPLLEIIEEISRLGPRNNKKERKDTRYLYEDQLSRLNLFMRLEKSLNQIMAHSPPTAISRRLRTNITVGKGKAKSEATRRFNREAMEVAFADDPTKLAEMVNAFYPNREIDEDRKYYSFDDFRDLKKRYRKSDPRLAPFHNVLEQIIQFAPTKERFDKEKDYVDAISIRYCGLYDIAAMCETELKGKYEGDQLLKKIKSSILYILRVNALKYKERITATRFQELIDEDEDIHLEEGQDLEDYLYQLADRCDADPDDLALSDLMDKVARYITMKERVFTPEGSKESSNDEVIDGCENDAIKDLVNQTPVVVMHRPKGFSLLHYLCIQVKNYKIADGVIHSFRNIKGQGKLGENDKAAYRIVVRRAHSKRRHAGAMVRREIANAGIDVPAAINQDLLTRKELEAEINSIKKSKATKSTEMSAKLEDLEKQLDSIPSEDDLNELLVELDGNSFSAVEREKRRH